MCKNKNINLTYHSKNMKHQYLYEKYQVSLNENAFYVTLVVVV